MMSSLRKQGPIRRSLSTCSRESGNWLRSQGPGSSAGTTGNELTAPRPLRGGRVSHLLYGLPPPRLPHPDRTVPPANALHRCAILDDYQNVALQIPDWSKLSGWVELTGFTAA